MKHMNMIKKYGRLNLQIFAEGGDKGDGDDNGEDSGDDGNEGDDGDGEDDDPDEKLFSQADVDKAIEKRIAREKRKWKREQAKEKNLDSKDKAGDGKGNANKVDAPKVKELEEKASKADELGLKWTCLEHDVDKSCVDDVLALAKVHMAKDEDMDIEDAIDKVLKKYPQFKTGASNSDEEEDTDSKRAWGQRQKSKGSKISGVEAAFLKKNPGLKID